MRSFVCSLLKFWTASFNENCSPPENSTTQVNIVFDEPHATIPGSAALVVIANDIVCRVWISTEVALNEVSGLIRQEPEQDVESVDITGV